MRPLLVRLSQLKMNVAVGIRRARRRQHRRHDTWRPLMRAQHDIRLERLEEAAVVLDLRHARGRRQIAPVEQSDAVRRARHASDRARRAMRGAGPPRSLHRGPEIESHAPRVRPEHLRVGEGVAKHEARRGLRVRAQRMPAHAAMRVGVGRQQIVWHDVQHVDAMLGGKAIEERSQDEIPDPDAIGDDQQDIHERRSLVRQATRSSVCAGFGSGAVATGGGAGDAPRRDAHQR